MSQLAPRNDVDGFLRAGAVGLYALVVLTTVGAALAVHCNLVDPYEPALLRPMCGFLLFVFLFSIVSWRILTGAWFDSYTIFLAAAHSFNGGQVFLEAFGLHRHGILEGQFPHNDVVDAILFTTLCLVALHAGAIVAVLVSGRPSAEARADESKGESRGATLADLRQVAWFLLAIAAPSMAYVFLNDIGTALSQGYLALYGGQHDVGIAAIPKILSAFLVPSALFLLAGSKDSRLGRATSLLVLVINACCQLLLGFRFYAIMPLAAYAWVRNRCIGPLPVLPLAAAGAFLAIVVFPIIRNTRDTGADRRSFEGVAAKMSGLEYPELSTIDEMGGSILTTIYTQELVPRTRDFEYGETYFYALFRLVPNVAWDIHPSIAHTPSLWLIEAIEPWLAARGGSFGFSVLAEAYLNFGWTGGPWVIALLGFLFARFTLWATRRPGLVEAKIAMAAAFVSYFAFVAREDLGFVVRPLVWYSLAPYAAIHLLAWARRALGRPAVAVRHSSLTEERA